VQDIEVSDATLDRFEPVDEGAAHGVGFPDEIGGTVKGATVVTDVFRAVAGSLGGSLSREHVDFDTAPGQGGGELGNVGRDAPDGNGPEAFPGKERHPHEPPLRMLAVLTAARPGYFGSV
jgi:hypothetical protein